ncbi:helix-turn-helix domain-containing protein [Haloglycomyces albus]|uniref:helix-turn-helix domain-containing protein n=1 Tax=Haloglycomyces albus TaxID=526067 RepID=UPI00046D16B4|nr:helix-turn-helix transcriptional regulator [Haloglycomyces albus]
MIRPELTPQERRQGKILGRSLKTARGERRLDDVAYEAEISPETLRKIENGRILSPNFFSIARLCRALGVSLDELAAEENVSDGM